MDLSSNDMQLDLSSQLEGRHKSTSIRNSANARQQIQSMDVNGELSPPAFPMLSPPMPVEYIYDEDEDDKGTDE